MVEGRAQSSCITPASCGGRGEALSAWARRAPPSSCITRACTGRGESLSAQRARVCKVSWGSAPVLVSLSSVRQLPSCHNNLSRAATCP